MKRFALALVLSLSSISFVPAVAQPTVDLNVHNADLSAVIDLIATQAHINIIVDGSVVSHPVTFRLLHVPLNVALQAIESSYGLAGTWQNGVLHLGDPAIVNRTYPTGNGIVAHVFVLRNSNPGAVGASLASSLPVGTLIVPDTRSNSVLVKGSSFAVAAAEQIIAALDKPQYGTISFSSYAQPLSNVAAADALSVLKDSLTITAPDSAVINTNANEIILTGTPDFVAAARGVLFDLDKPGREIEIKVRVLDVTPINDQSDVGLLFGGMSISGTPVAATGATAYIFGSPLTANLFNVTLNTMVAKGGATILAEPSISALNNQKATFNVGESYPIVYYDAQLGTEQVQFVQAGVNLAITPTIGQDDDITVNLNIGYSQILSFVQNYPVIGQRQAQTVLRVKNNQSIVISGLFSDITSTTVTKIPWLGDIPIIGKIFQNRATSHTRDEIIFILQPHILTAQDFQRPLGVPSAPTCSRTNTIPC